MGRVTPATAAAPARRALATLSTALLVCVAAVGRADGAEQAWSASRTPAAACPGADDPGASFAVQRRAIACLLNRARTSGRLSRLGVSRALQRAAVLKGREVASCGDFSHTPCGADFAATARAAGYRYALLAENLFVGTAGWVSPRSVVEAWLRSPGHRENVLRPGLRHLGVAGVEAQGLLGSGTFVVWVATFGSPR